MSKKKWYYAKRGNIKDRGVIDDAQLKQMAESGELDPEDLLCEEGASSGGWTRASAIEGLIKPQDPLVAEDTGAPAGTCFFFRFSRVIIIAAILGGLVLLVWLRPQKTEKKASLDAVEKEEIKEQIIKQSAADRWAVVVATVRDQLDSGNIAAAEALLSRMRLITGENDEVKELSLAISQAKAKQQYDNLIAGFKTGLLDERGIRELAELSESTGEKEVLIEMLATMLSDQQSLTSRRCKFIATAAKIFGDDGLRQFAAKEFFKRSGKVESEEWCFEAVDFALKNNMWQEAVNTLDFFLSKHAHNVRANYELAALLALEGKKGDSVSALKRAIKFGGSKVKDQAKTDTRFDKIKNSWTFKWAVR